LANILNTDFDNLMAVERRYKDHRYSRVALYIRLHSEANDNERFFGSEKQDIHVLSRQEKSNKPKSPQAIMERNPYSQEIEKTELQILTEDFLLSDIPNEVKATVFEETTSLVRDIFQAAQNKTPIVEVLKQKQETLQQKGGVIFVGQPQPPEAGQAPELSEIPRWQGRKQDGMPLAFIQAHYGQWLSAFDAEQDAVFQDQIRKHDPKLLQGVSNQLREEGQNRKVREIVKPRSARLDRELANVTVEDLKKAPRLASTFYTRQRRATEATVTHPSQSVTHKN
jgi:hypothetical protein